MSTEQANPTFKFVAKCITLIAIALIFMIPTCEGTTPVCKDSTRLINIDDEKQSTWNCTPGATMSATAVDIDRLLLSCHCENPEVPDVDTGP